MDQHGRAVHRERAGQVTQRRDEPAGRDDRPGGYPENQAGDLEPAPAGGGAPGAGRGLGRFRIAGSRLPFFVPVTTQKTGSCITRAVSLRPGQTRTVTLLVPRRQLQYWDDTRGWLTAAGPRPLDVGPDEQADALSATVTVRG